MIFLSKKIKKGTLPFFLVTLFFLPFFAQAADFATSKDILEFSVETGAFASSALSLNNQSFDEELKLSVRLQLWRLRDGSDDIAYIAAEPGGVLDWFTLTTGSEDDVRLGRSGVYRGSHIVHTLLQPREALRFEVTVKPPIGAPAGAYFVMLRAAAQPGSSGNIKIIPEIAVPIFLNVIDSGDPANYGASVPQLSVDGAAYRPWLSWILRRPVFKSQPTQLAATIANTGTHFFRLNGSYGVSSWFRKKEAIGSLPARYVIPGRERTVSYNLPVREKTFIQSISGGPYAARIILRTPEGGELVATSTYFVVPLSRWLSLLFIFCFLLFVLRFRKNVVAAIKVFVRDPKKQNNYSKLSGQSMGIRKIRRPRKRKSLTDSSFTTTKKTKREASRATKKKVTAKGKTVVRKKTNANKSQSQKRDI